MVFILVLVCAWLLEFRGGSIYGAPLIKGAFFGCHAEFCPSAAPAFLAAARSVEGFSVPLGTGAARFFAGGEGFGRGDGEACASEAVRGVAEASKHFAIKHFFFYGRRLTKIMQFLF